MCGIVGYIGKEKNIHFLVDTLKYLEYRGYDSCGVAVAKNRGVFLQKSKGKIENLKARLKEQKFSLGIAHTRWATHGVPNHLNSHPHFDCCKEIFVVHNGIIENYATLRDRLIRKGHKFISQTDTEVIPHLLEEFNKKEDIFEALIHTVEELEGSFAIVLFRKNNHKLLFAKKDSPLILGILEEGFLLTSDIPAIVPFTKELINIEDESLGVLEDNRYSIFDFNGKHRKLKKEKVELHQMAISKKNYSHFMLKEIFEQPKVMERLINFYVKDEEINFKDLNLPLTKLKEINKIFIFACGTAYHAGFVGKYLLEKYVGVDVEIDVSSEARYRKIKFSSKDLVLAISQSGETADTLAAVREAKRKGVKVLGICNVLGSTLTKESDGLISTLAGPEIGVASTKAYTAQVFSLLLFSLYLARVKNIMNKNSFTNFLKELKNVSLYQKEVLERTNEIEKIANKFSRFGCFLFLGRGINYPSALEGALKLKEISYIPAEGYPAGEMKHGPIALIDEYRAVVCIAIKDELYSKMISNVQEIKARKGKVLGVVNDLNEDEARLMDEIITIPNFRITDISPLVVAIPLQLFAYFVAKNLGCEIDQPRNLAKSVTVE
ncbi:MAG: glutamine--fructose-6-phosphate transaminase (isomerizing) [Candidatus Omnitrophica bacterium]|nr:glutamine--fructose-6-phosphate transaminase (isomerizing) [Candidatus Omnitrophota bacterium]